MHYMLYDSPGILSDVGFLRENQHFLYFLPLPQGQGAFLPTFTGILDPPDSPLHPDWCRRIMPGAGSVSLFRVSPGFCRTDLLRGGRSRTHWKVDDGSYTYCCINPAPLRDVVGALEGGRWPTSHAQGWRGGFRNRCEFDALPSRRWLPCAKPYGGHPPSVFPDEVAVIPGTETSGGKGGTKPIYWRNSI